MSERLVGWIALAIGLGFVGFLLWGVSKAMPVGIFLVCLALIIAFKGGTRRDRYHRHD